MTTPADREAELATTVAPAPAQPAATEADPAAIALATAGPQPAAESAAHAAGAHAGASLASASSRAYGAKGGPEIAATPEAMGQHTANEMHKANMDPGSGGQYDLDHGLHYSYNYERECKDAGEAKRWKDEYRYGYNASGQFDNPQDTGGFMDFRLKKGHSASAGIKAWLKGLTVAECLTAVFAMEYETLRATVGDKKFDQTFGSANAHEDAAVEAGGNRLRIAPSSDTPISQYLKATKLAELSADGKHTDGQVSDKELDDNLVPGQWYYFYNHPKYLLKHPGGAWQGENSLYMGRSPTGKRLWAGLGASNKTEDAMIKEMVDAYGGARDSEDERTMRERGITNADGTYANKKYDPKSGEFKDVVSRSEILHDAPYTIDGTERHGGFLAGAGNELDVDAVKKLKAS